MNNDTTLVDTNTFGVFMECQRGEEQAKTGQPVDFMLAELVDELLAKRPMWTFVSKEITSGATARIRKVSVMSGGTAIGWLQTSTAYRGGVGARVYEFSGTDTDANLKRRGYRTTTKLSSAVEHILSEFRELSKAEIVRKQLSNARSAGGNLIFGARNAYNRASANYRLELLRAIDANYSRLCSEAGVPAESIPALALTHEKCCETEELSTKGMALVLMDGVVYCDDIPNALVKQTDELMEVLAVLKLLPVNSVMPGFGMRVAEDAFWVRATLVEGET